MVIGIYKPTRISLSALSYIQNIISAFEGNEIRYICFNDDSSMPVKVDVYWDPRCMGGDYPYIHLNNVTKPVVATVHGSGPLSLPYHEYYPDLKKQIIGQMISYRRLWYWRKFRSKIIKVITVSNYAKKEIMETLNIDRNKIVTIYHGVNHKIFCEAGQLYSHGKPYFLHVSQFQPKKNVARIIAAYKRMKNKNAVDLIMIVPGYREYCSQERGITILRYEATSSQLAELYRGARALIFPSLHETFGLPIVEAMACGCPVLTSNTTACPEVAGNAALLVNPRSIDSMADEMDRLALDDNLCGQLRYMGLSRSRMYTWESSAIKHLTLFQDVLKLKQTPIN